MESVVKLLLIALFLVIVLGIPTWLGLRQARYMTDGLKRPDRCGVTKRPTE